MKSISQAELARLQSRGARVIPLPKPEKPPVDAPGLAGVFDDLSAFLREGARKGDVQPLAERADAIEAQIARMRADLEAEIAALRAGAVATEEAMQALEGEIPRVAERIARKAVAAQPVPEVKEIHHHPVIETREIVQPVHTVETRVVERVEERMLEADKLSSVSVQRDRFGRISAITRGDVVYAVVRDKDGLISRVEPRHGND